MHWVCSREHKRVRDAEYLSYYLIGFIGLTTLCTIKKLIREFIIRD